MNLGQDVKVLRVSNAVAAGTSNVNCSAVDTAGYDGVMFIAAFGAITATAVTGLKAQQDSDSGMGAAADLEASQLDVADTDDNKLAIVDVVKPRERYVRAVVVRGTANAVVDSVIAILYKGTKRPSVHDASTVIGAVNLQAPAEGTA